MLMPWYYSAAIRDGVAMTDRLRQAKLGILAIPSLWSAGWIIVRLGVLPVQDLAVSRRGKSMVSPCGIGLV
jgi:hypothetical protein